MRISGRERRKLHPADKGITASTVNNRSLLRRGSGGYEIGKREKITAYDGTGCIPQTALEETAAKKLVSGVDHGVQRAVSSLREPVWRSDQ